MRATDAYVEISVEDNGRGLSAEDTRISLVKRYMIRVLSA